MPPAIIHDSEAKNQNLNGYLFIGKKGVPQEYGADQLM